MPNIIIHHGAAHKDDFLCACLLLAKVENAVIFRRMPTAEEMDDANTYVVDVGGRYEPDRLNFDHHQFPEDKENPRCAFTLLLDYFGMLPKARGAWSWLRAAEILDCHGPKALSQVLGIDPKIFRESASPLEAFVIAEFSRRTELSLAGLRDWLPEIMAEFGGTLIHQLDKFHEEMELLNAEGKVRWIKGVAVLIVPRHEKGRPISLPAITRWQENVAPNAGIRIAPDARAQGLSLLRIDDHPRVDFSKIEGLEDVLFVPKGGWTAKTTTYDRQRCLELCELAIADK